MNKQIKFPKWLYAFFWMLLMAIPLIFVTYLGLTVDNYFNDPVVSLVVIWTMCIIGWGIVIKLVADIKHDIYW